MADPKKTAPVAMPPLYKQRSWSPDIDREEAWLRRRDLYRSRRGCHHRLSRSVTEEDLEELRGCIELGFGFGVGVGSPASFTTESSDDADRLSDTLPALDLYYAVHRNCSSDAPAAGPSPAGSPPSIYSPGESPRQVKMKLKQWAQVVACSVRQHLP